MELQILYSKSITHCVGYKNQKKIEENRRKSKKIEENRRKSKKIEEKRRKTKKIKEHRRKSMKIEENRRKSKKIKENRRNRLRNLPVPLPTRPGVQNRCFSKGFQIKTVDFSIPGRSRTGPALKIDAFLKAFN